MLDWRIPHTSLRPGAGHQRFPAMTWMPNHPHVFQGFSGPNFAPRIPYLFFRNTESSWVTTELLVWPPWQILIILVEPSHASLMVDTWYMTGWDMDSLYIFVVRWMFGVWWGLIAWCITTLTSTIVVNHWKTQHFWGGCWFYCSSEPTGVPWWTWWWSRFRWLVTKAYSWRMRDIGLWSWKPRLLWTEADVFEHSNSALPLVASNIFPRHERAASHRQGCDDLLRSGQLSCGWLSHQETWS